VQNGTDLRADQPLGQFAKVRVQDGFEGACHVGGCGKEFGQARVSFQLPTKLFLRGCGTGINLPWLRD
jgi:hypothetical protein